MIVNFTQQFWSNKSMNDTLPVAVIWLGKRCIPETCEQPMRVRKMSGHRARPPHRATGKRWPLCAAPTASLSAFAVSNFWPFPTGNFVMAGNPYILPLIGAFSSFSLSQPAITIIMAIITNIDYQCTKNSSHKCKSAEILSIWKKPSFTYWQTEKHRPKIRSHSYGKNFTLTFDG